MLSEQLMPLKSKERGGGHPEETVKVGRGILKPCPLRQVGRFPFCSHLKLREANICFLALPALGVGCYFQGRQDLRGV